MTWIDGNFDKRVLTGAEAKLFAFATSLMIDFFDNSYLKDTLPCIRDCQFAYLTLSHQFTILEEVAIALLTKTRSCPDKNVLNEAAINHIYCNFMTENLAYEIEMLTDGSTEEMGSCKEVVDAYNECFPEGQDLDEDEDHFWDMIERPHIKCTDEKVWNQALERLANRLVDSVRDYECYKPFGGFVMPRSYLMMQKKGIIPSYFNVPAKIVEGAKKRTYNLCNFILEGNRAGVTSVVKLSRTAKCCDDDYSLLPICTILESIDCSEYELNFLNEGLRTLGSFRNVEQSVLDKWLCDCGMKTMGERAKFYDAISELKLLTGEQEPTPVAGISNKKKTRKAPTVPRKKMKKSQAGNDESKCETTSSERMVAENDVNERKKSRKQQKRKQEF